MYKDSDIKRLNSVYALLMMHSTYRQADEPRIWTQLAKFHVKPFPHTKLFIKKTINMA